ncbi:helix-turn-helix domain-containing protein [Phaeacidiphilus oryzae]|uniref:helix-turn-helix domain-containing protein n=1 Tax=Phaeacidiphilus oryzae TaxID=348818 RepID=UPI00056B4758|nr:helix-turn-helix transcriptional regulator [Phaeacidiphilus oryzae]
MTDLGRLITQQRHAAGMTQAQLADGAGITQAALSRIENGKTSPRLSTVERIAHALGRPLTLTVGDTTGV